MRDAEQTFRLTATQVLSPTNRENSSSKNETSLLVQESHFSALC